MSVICHPLDDGTTLLQVATDDMVQEWIVDGDVRTLVASVYCPWGVTATSEEES